MASVRATRSARHCVVRSSSGSPAAQSCTVLASCALSRPSSSPLRRSARTSTVNSERMPLTELLTRRVVACATYLSRLSLDIPMLTGSRVPICASSVRVPSAMPDRTDSSMYGIIASASRESPRDCLSIASTRASVDSVGTGSALIIFTTSRICPAKTSSTDRVKASSAADEIGCFAFVHKSR